MIRPGHLEGIAVQRLAAADFRAAYPLVRAAIPTLGLDSWLRFARRIADPDRAGRSGIMAAWRKSRPYPAGLFWYRRDCDLECGTALHAHGFIAIDIIDHRPIVHALVAALEELGNTLGCQVIRPVIDIDADGLLHALLAAGYRREAATFGKAVASASLSCPRPE